MWIWDILWDNEAWFSFHFLLAANDFDSTPTWLCTWLHNIHVLVVIGFSIHRKLSEIIGEEVSLGAEIILGENSSHPTEVLPHHIFATNLERLREMIYLLVFSSFFHEFRFRLTSPLNVPFRAVGSNYSTTTCFQWVNDRVINMSRFGYFETKSHVVLLEVLLFSNLNFLERF